MHAAPLPDFLELPARAVRPRFSGLTHVLDKGLPFPALEHLLAMAGPFVDLWKFGWGTSYLDPEAGRKVELLGRHSIRACVGGTLLEIAWAQGKADDLFAWAFDTGFLCVEVSNGAVAMPALEKRRLIASASERFAVLAEVGSKDPSAEISPSRWTEEMIEDLAAGATWILTEGRESGTVGLYTAEGRVREDMVRAITATVSLNRLIFEAPHKDQQAWFIRRFGSNINLGNVLPSEVMGLEALRLGLRADTIELSLSASPVGTDVS